MTLNYSLSTSADGRQLLTLLDSIDAFIPGDIHIPFHDVKAVNTALDYAAGWTSTCIITGDFIDNYGLSPFPKDPKTLAKYRVVDEAAGTAKVVDRLEKQFENVIYIPGNHETRWDSIVKKTPALDGLEWWWPLRGHLPSHWVLLNPGARIRQKAADGRWVYIEHGDKVNRSPSFVTADKLTTLYPDQITIIGHNHRLAAHHRTHWTRNRCTISSAYSVGHLSSVKKTGYISNPDWQLGFGLLSRTGNVDLKQVYRGRVL